MAHCPASRFFKDFQPSYVQIEVKSWPTLHFSLISKLLSTLVSGAYIQKELSLNFKYLPYIQGGKKIFCPSVEG